MRNRAQIVTVIVVMWVASQLQSCFGSQLSTDPFNKVGENQRVAVARDPRCPYDDPSLPLPREASLAVCTMHKPEPNPSGLNMLGVFFLQFAADHDHVETQKAQSTGASTPVPAGDPHFESAGITSIRLFPSADGAPNLITPLIDGSAVYGSDDKTLASVRDGDTAYMETRNGGMLPYDAGAGVLLPAKRAGGIPRKCGDKRCFENSFLATLHNIFILGHNVYAKEYTASHSDATPDEVFAAARTYMVALQQKILYENALRSLLGSHSVCPKSTGPRDGAYQIPAFLSAAGGRFHHLLTGSVSPKLAKFVAERTGKNADDISLIDLYFNSDVFKTGRVLSTHIESMANTPAQAPNPSIVPEIQNMMFHGKPGHSGMHTAGMDIVTFTVAHSRLVKKDDGVRGIGTYNDVRRHLGLPVVRNWADITPDRAIQARLASVYSSVDKVDAWIGMVSEPRFQDSSLGQTMTVAYRQELCASAASDPNFYTVADLDPEVRAQLEQDSFSKLVQRTTGLDTVHPVRPFSSPLVRHPIRARRSRTLAMTNHYIPRLAWSPSDTGSEEETTDVPQDDAVGAPMLPVYPEKVATAMGVERDAYSSSCCGQKGCGGDCYRTSCSCSDCCYDDGWYAIGIFFIFVVVIGGLIACIACTTPSHPHAHTAKSHHHHYYRLTPVAPGPSKSDGE